jgi:hypothetical protein
MKATCLAVIVLLLTGCAQIQHYEHVSKPTGVPQTASIGSELYRIQKERDLPNAFGRADIYGGKVNEGFSELRYMGRTQDGYIVFRLTDIDIVSNETVFTRYGVSQTVISTNTNASATMLGNTATGSANTTGVATHFEKPKAEITKLPPNTVEFVFDPAEKVLRLESVDVEIREVTDYSITYVLHKK